MATSFFNNNCADDVEEIESAKNYADLAKDWAIKLDGQVDGIDFSSKFWALQAAESSAAKIVVEDDGVPLGSEFNVLNFGVGISVLQTAANEVQIQASGDVFTEIFTDGVDYTAGSSTDIVLSEDPVSEKNVDIYFDGVRQQTDQYGISGTMVTFTSAIPVGVGSIEVKYPRTLDVGVATANNILYGSTGATANNFFDQALVTFSNKASMQAATWLTAGMKVRTLGFTSSGDKGENEYNIGTFGTADGVFIIDLTNGLQAQRIHAVALDADNLQEVKDATFLYVGDTATFSGYTTSTDGGGNKVEIVAAGTGTDDGGSFIDLSGSGLQAKALFPGNDINVVQFGCVLDGATDNLTALTNAITYTAANGLWLSGVSRGRVCAVSGNFTLPSNAWIKDLHLLQLDPAGSASRRTITSSSAENLRLIRVKVDINGDGTNGNVTDYAGIWLAGGSNHIFQDVEVTGDMIGRAFFVVNASNFVVNKAYIHDINYSLLSDPGDDQINGINLQGCTSFIFYANRVMDLGGDFGGGATNRYTRGIALTGCENFSLSEIHIENIGQASDLTGGINNGNVNFTYTNSQAVNCFSWGFKFANSANTGTIGNLTSRDAGLGGFVVSGGSGGVAEAWISKDVVLNNCKAIDTGSNGQWPNPRGFSVSQGTTDPTTPFGVKFIGCQALDEQVSPTMVDGFYNDVAAQSGKLNECIDCESRGHTNLAFNGVHFPVATARRATDQAVASTSTTQISFDSIVDDTAAMVSGTNITIRKDGSYRFMATGGFEANAAGTLREIRVLKGGTLIGGALFTRPPSSENTYLTVEQTAIFEAGDVLQVAVRQDSGVTLDILANTARFVIEHIQ